MAGRNSTLTQQRLKELLDYNAETGVFTWRMRRGMALAGSVAGNKRADGRITIYVDDKPHEAAQLAWLYVHGEFPPKKLRRRNGDNGDNSIANFHNPHTKMPKVVYPPLTAERLRDLVHYNPDTGVFTRLQVTGKIGKVGDVAGSMIPNGRIEFSVDSKRYLAHRLAWLYMTGNWPKREIDHIDGDPTNNRFANLRDVPRHINAQNVRKARANSKSGVLGVKKRYRKWRAEISVNGKVLFIGSFETRDEAYAAFVEAKRLYHAGNTL